MRGCLWLGLLASLGIGCGDEADLIVDLRTDLVPGVDFSTVRTELSDDLPVSGIIEEVDSRETTIPPQVADLTTGRRIAEFAGLQPGTDRVLRVRLFQASGALVAERIVRVRLEETLAVTVLVTRDCSGIECPGVGPADAISCLGGTCVNPTCTRLGQEGCGPAECAAAADCAPMDDCADAVCADGACFYPGDDSRCPDGLVCHAVLGCVDVAVPVDASVPDGGVDAGDPDAGPCEAVPEICNGRDDDCDTNVDETFNLQADVGNCGACNVACDETNGTPSCMSGVCTIACDPGFDDCDGSAETGCEVDLATDTNCGMCGLVCSGGTPICGPGVGGPECTSMCAETMCGASCVDTDTSLAHCGACDTPCSPVAATPQCVAGICTIMSCDPLRQDCDGLVSTGCEVDLGADGSNCGACGVACHPSETCVDGRCTCGSTQGPIGGGPACGGMTCCGGTCGGGSMTDPSNCGGCGIRCGVGESCVGGRCTCGGSQGGVGGGRVCTAAQTCCEGSGDCVDLTTDPTNCGGCGVDCGFESCEASACECGGMRGAPGGGQVCPPSMPCCPASMMCQSTFCPMA